MVYTNSLKITNSISKDNFKIVELSNNFPIIHVLSNDKIFAQNSQKMMLLDGDWSITKSIDVKSNMIFNNLNLIAHYENTIFISEIKQNNLMVVDFDLKTINNFCVGKHSEFPGTIHALSYRNNKLYVLILCESVYDQGGFMKEVKQEIMNFEMNVIYSDIFINMKASDKTAFLSKHPRCISCHTLEDLNVVRSYAHPIGKISEVDNYFYEISANLTLFCYDSSGFIVNKLDIKETVEKFKDIENIYLAQIKNNLFIFTKSLKCIKFKS